MSGGATRPGQEGTFADVSVDVSSVAVFLGVIVTEDGEFTASRSIHAPRMSCPPALPLPGFHVEFERGHIFKMG